MIVSPPRSSAAIFECLTADRTDTLRYLFQTARSGYLIIHAAACPYTLQTGACACAPALLRLGATA